MSTFTQIKSAVRANLNDGGVSFYSAADLTEAMEDAYSDIFFQTRCLIKKVTLNFIDRNYYDFKLLGVEDFMCVIAIYNNNTNRWLFDNVTLRDFDSFRYDWELWQSQPQFWAPVNFDLNVIVPYLTSPTGTFDLYYAAKAPDVDDDSVTPLIATDMQKLLEWYATGDMLESSEEFKKAGAYLSQYNEQLEEYSSRVKNLARRDLLITI